MREYLFIGLCVLTTDLIIENLINRSLLRKDREESFIVKVSTDCQRL